MQRWVGVGLGLVGLSVVGGCALLVGDFELAGSTTSANCDGSSTSGGPCNGGAACAPGSICAAGGCSNWPTWPIPNTNAGLPNPASYTALNGYVLDNVTGLSWQQPIDSDNANCAEGCTQADAIEYCANLELAGQCDWRLPTRIELVSIVDYNVSQPSINAVFAGTPADYFWTSSPFQPNTESAWTVGFYDGYASVLSTSNAGHVRCVR